MGKRKDLSEFDKGQNVTAIRLGQSIFKTATLMGCSWSAMVSIYQKWSKDGKVVNQQQGHGRPRLMRLGSKVWPAWSDSTGELLLLLLGVGLDRRRPVRVPMLSPSHCRKCRQ